MPNKFAIIHPNLNLRGGAERKLLLIAQRLIHGGHTVELYIHQFDLSKTFAEMASSELKIYSRSGSKASWMLWMCSQLLFKRYDAVIISNYPANIPAALAGLFKPWLKLYWICNEVAPLLASKKSLLWRFFFSVEKLLSQRINHITANSSYTAKEIGRYYGEAHEVIRSGVELKLHIDERKCRSEILQLAHSTFWFSLSRIEKHKNIDLFLKAARTRTQDRFVLAGVGSDVEWLASQLSEVPNLTYLGAVNEDEKFYLMRASRGFLFLPTHEPLGVTVMEAISQQTPVLAFNSGGPKEVVVNQSNGILADTELDYFSNLDQPLFARVLEKEVSVDYIAEKFSNQRMVEDFNNSILKFIE